MKPRPLDTGVRQYDDKAKGSPVIVADIHMDVMY
jgi:hypothetical protein